MSIKVGCGTTPCQVAVGAFVDLAGAVDVLGAGTVALVLPFSPAPLVEPGAVAGAGVLDALLDSALRESVR